METYLLTIQDFEERYEKSRSNINSRINGLKQKGYDMEAQRLEGKNVYNAEQVRLMDELHKHLKNGRTIAAFPAAHASAGLDSVLQDRRQVSYRTQDRPEIATSIKPNEPAPAVFGIAALMDSIAGKVVDIITARQQLPPAPIADPLANLRSLQEACDRGWLLSSSQLAPLVGLKNLGSKDFERFGFKFERAGKNGAEAAWKVQKP
ncbi:hypothetical protein H6F43_03540 [Leptolyngbya sp. FACHB-36]|uniref:hypothetical protein n=1 Tax=Leptolyngbya sp. FACHB-36 TaxID=2692808 RepID=UPI001681853A|nr:hypothetical protein [Leptolyngbya sp. FACHB-36]MBD2019255.1 hypothetical protein [Leptolyngbya sp. FACHB-36]